MTDEKKLKQAQIEPLASKAPVDSLSRNKRRRLLKGVVALPVIMTLHSGAALARTSNMVGDSPSSGDAQIDMEGRLLCAHPDPTETQVVGGPYDLGMTPSGHYEPHMDINNVPISLDDQAINCRAGGGVVISGIAFTSIMSRSGFNIM